MRLFLGIPISEEIREKIREMQKELAEEGIKLVEPENLHLTLTFLGEAEAEGAKKALGRIFWGKQFEVLIKGVGVFPNEKRIKVVWAGGADGGKMAELNKKIEESLGITAGKEFVNHLTLARVKFVKDKKRLQTFLRKYKDWEGGKVGVEKAVLYASELTPKGPVYRVLEEYKLG